MSGGRCEGELGIIIVLKLQLADGSCFAMRVRDAARPCALNVVLSWRVQRT